MPLKFIISGGGTGGHIFPAVAIAKEILATFPDAELLFVGASGRMEMEKIPQEGFRIIGLDISGIQRKFTLKNLWVPIKFIRAFFKSKSIIKQFNPNAVIGTGGYASAAIVYAATKMNIPTLIWEGNSQPGLSNKLLSKKVNIICTGLPGLESHFPKNKVKYTGNPVRASLFHLPEKKEALDYFKLKPNKPVLFVTGGSLGARTINLAIYNGLMQFQSEGIQLIWQTGKNFDPGPRMLDGVWHHTFIKEMEYAYAASDLVISRAGALSIAEITVCGKPCILVPSPNVTEDHQTKNALALYSTNATLLIPDAEADDKLVSEAIRLIKNTQKLQKMQHALLQMAKPNATKEIVSHIASLIKTND